MQQRTQFSGTCTEVACSPNSFEKRMWHRPNQHSSSNHLSTMKQKFFLLTLSIIALMHQAQTQNNTVSSASTEKLHATNHTPSATAGRVQPMPDSTGHQSLLSTFGNWRFASQFKLLDNEDAGALPINMTIVNSVGYVINESGRLGLYNCSPTGAIQPLGSVATGSQPTGIAVSQQMAYVVSKATNRLQVFDCSNPAAPQLVGSAVTGNGPQSIAVNGTIAYVVNAADNTLQIFNCGIPAQPKIMGTINTGISPQKVAARNGIVFVINSGSNTLQIFDCNNLLQPVLLSTINTGSTPNSLVMQNNIAYILNEHDNTLQLIDCSNTSIPYTISITPTYSNPLALAVNRGKAYVATAGMQGNLLFAYNCSSPAMPVLWGYTGTLPYPSAATSSNDVIYVLAGQSGMLQSLSDSILSNPGYIGQMSNNGAVAVTQSSLGDDLGDHIATRNLRLDNNMLVGSNDTAGINITSDGLIQQTPMQNALLTNGWVHYDVGFASAAFYKDKEGRVHIQGLIAKGKIAPNTVLFQLPVHYRPYARLMYSVDNNGPQARIDVLADGTVVLMRATTNFYLNLTGISFLAEDPDQTTAKQ
jgi:hypothetical protein